MNRIERQSRFLRGRAVAAAATVTITMLLAVTAQSGTARQTRSLSERAKHSGALVGELIDWTDETVIARSSHHGSAAAAAAKGQPLNLTTYDLGTLGGEGAGIAGGVNDRDQVTGVATTADGEFHAFLWENGVMTDIGANLGTFSQGQDINNAGWIVGWYAVDDGPGRAFLWRNGAVTDLGTLGGDFARAFSINDNGQVVGTSSTAEGEHHAFLWQNGVMTDLGWLGFGEGIARHINNSGQIVGWGGTQFIADALVWQDGVMTDINDLFGSFASFANGNNDQGDIVGFARFDDGLRFGFVLHNGIVTFIDDPEDEVDSSEARAINNQGYVTGILRKLPAFPPGRAFVWKDGAVVQVLANEPGVWAFQSAGFDINARNHVCGYGYAVTDDGLSQHAFFAK